MKKGISLIVLVITIIVMIIIAGAIIISLNNSNVVAKSEEAVYTSNVAELRSAVALVYSDKYIAYLEATRSGETVDPVDIDDITGDSTVAALLTKVNNNTLGKVVTITFGANGPVVNETTTTP